MNVPEGATHFRKKISGGNLFMIYIEGHEIYGDHYFIWLGHACGGWSFKMPFRHLNLDSFTEITK
tara:strand:- start:317 stop:511 length:195 start_codon:yes stop_codon:yes gene_type:complete